MKWNLFFVLLILLFACTLQEKSEPRAKDYNDEMIYNLALSQPFFDCKSCLIGTDQECDFIKKDILSKDKVLIDPNLNLTLVLHGWTNYGGDFPKWIVYVSNNAGFEYAFPFYDEFYYHKKIDESRSTFGDHINFIAKQLNLDNSNRLNDVERLITLVADSLLNLKEYSTKDSSDFRKSLQADLEDASLYNKLCAEKINSNINKIVSEASRPNVRYFKCKEGKFGYWRIEIESKNNRLKVSSSFENQECYLVVLL